MCEQHGPFRNFTGRCWDCVPPLRLPDEGLGR